MQALSEGRVVLSHGFQTPGVVIHRATKPCALTLFLVRRQACHEEVRVAQDDPSVTLRITISGDDTAIVFNSHPSTRQAAIQRLPMEEGDVARISASCHDRYAVYGFVETYA